ncbi:MerR family transcriptional regulator [Desulfocarbo indianensis]|nr:MerR family transcriptional regulator [Desulfocarbo indianensis]
MPEKPREGERLYTISELAAELGLTPRAIRFYEEKGLISPQRSSGNHRLYDRRDRARLKLVLRGRRFGYTLDEIAEMLGPAHDPLDEAGQIQRSLAYGERTLKEIARRQAELDEIKRDLQKVKRKLQARLRQLTMENDK